MILISKDFIFVQMFSDMVADDMLQDLTRHRCKGHWAVIFRPVLVSFFKSTTDVCSQPVFRELTVSIEWL